MKTERIDRTTAVVEVTHRLCRPDGRVLSKHDRESDAVSMRAGLIKRDKRMADLVLEERIDGVWRPVEPS